MDDFAVDNFVLVGANASKALVGSDMVVTGHSASQTSGLDKTYTALTNAEIGVLALKIDRLTAGSVTSLNLALHRGATTSNVTFSNDTAAFFQGGRWLAAHLDEWPTVRDATVANLRVRELVTNEAPWSPQVKFESLYRNAKGRPTVILMFDDALDSIINTAYPLMSARSLKGTCPIPSASVGGVGKLTLANLTTLYAAGWDMSCNSTDDTAFTAMADTATALANIQTVQSYLTTNGFTRARQHGVYPNGTKTKAIADAFRTAGFLTMRTTEPQSFYTRMGVPFGVAMAMPSQGYTTATFAANSAARLTECKLRGTTQVFHFHADIADAGAAVFTAFLDQLVTDRDAGLLDILTISEWWARDGAVDPVNTVAPAVTGTEEVGETLSVSDGTWTGDPVIAFTYQWYRSPSTAISGATSDTYELQAEDEGETIFCRVTGTNGSGSDIADSNTTGAIAPASAEWAPTDLGAALIAWYDANLEVFNDAGTTPATNTQAVQQWNDQSGNDYHLSNADSGTRPHYFTAGFNGVKGIRFEAQFLATAAAALALGGDELSVFLAIQINEVQGNGRIVSFIATGQAEDWNTVLSAVVCMGKSGTNIGPYRGTSDKGSFTVVQDAPITLGIVFDGVDATTYFDNVAQTSPVASTGTFGATGMLGLGARPDGASAVIDIVVAEMIVTNSAIAAGDRNDLEAYLVAKWGI